MLPQINRLKNNNDFKLVLKQGKSVMAGPIFLKFKKNKGGEIRFGISIGLKFSKNAVERNMAKRKIREIIRKNLDYFKKGFDVIIIPRRTQSKNSNSNNWEEAFKEAVGKANLLTNN